MRILNPITPEFAWSRPTLSPIGMADVLKDFDRIVESFLRPTFASTINFQPSCDVNETKEHYLVSFDMPGVKKEDIKIEVQGNELVISGERRERTQGKFERTFTLPSTIAAEKIEAHYENGVLNVALPKAEAAKARTIQIQTGQGGLLGKLLGTKKNPVKNLQT